MYIVCRQSLDLLELPSAHKLSFEKPGFEPPTPDRRFFEGRRLNHRLRGPVGGIAEGILFFADEVKSDVPS